MAETSITYPAAGTTPAPSARGHALQKLAAVFRREFGERVRNKWFLISTLLGPVFFAAITILPAWLAMRETGGSSERTNVTIVDATGAGLGDRVARALLDSAGANAVRPRVVTTDAAGAGAAREAALAEVSAKQRVGVLVLDSATLAGRRAEYAGRNASSIADLDRLRDVVRRQTLATRLEREGLDAARVTALTGTRLYLETQRVSETGKSEGSGIGGALVAGFVAILLYMLILIYGQYVLRSVLEEKTTRVAEVVVSSVKPDILLAGKVLGVGAVGLLQTVIWFGGAFAIGAYVMPFLDLKAQPPATAQAAEQVARAADATAALTIPTIGFGTVASALAFFVLGYVLYSALFAAAGAMCTTDQEAQQAALPVMLPLLSSVVLLQTMLQNPESSVSRFGAWFPLTAPILMPMRMAMVGTSALEVLAVIGGVAVACAAVLWLAARIYRVGLLMYGKKPTLPELARWVRQAG